MPRLRLRQVDRHTTDLSAETWNWDRYVSGRSPFGVPQRGTVYQPRATPWDRRSTKFGVLKERCIPLDRQRAGALCGVPSERIPFRVFPGFHPGLVCSAPLGHQASRSGVRTLWASMRCPASGTEPLGLICTVFGRLWVASLATSPSRQTHHGSFRGDMELG